MKFLKFQELGRVNPAFVNDSDQLGTDSDFQRYNGLPTVTSADETQNVVFILIIH